ncbi:MAG: SDR family oxidoreductase [Acidobacteria bacterium]|nr:SDR family oxidoreductase [Acidobacteriota bacterium]NIM62791.1 SDR family oxidoreductase [Acidobacteriota bacterium]NIO60947.1 SDR family oxidoreductase [Acidobacteriota bacterium]NIQ31417.1 SDR family oxidoreductase [Acidobacteriota bacterium]NIQ87416.1 SDR family oxidoreductase [Acidobacteriota bacterium]
MDGTECLAPGALGGKTIWITGGGTGLGKAMALRFASLGARVGVSGRRPDPLEQVCSEIESSGGSAAFAPCDVRRSAEVDEAHANLSDALGPLDALVNNAAGNFLCPAEDLSDNAFSAVVDIVLKGTFHCTRTAGRAWIAEKRRGAVLNIVTPYAWTGSAYVMPSSAAKAGVLAMTRSLTTEWARHDIRLNAIAPGPIPTEGAFSRLMPSDEMLKSVEAKIPAGRLGRPTELAELAAFLVSDAADWIRGEVVTLDGGEWIRRAGSFNDLVDLPPKMREKLSRAMRRK